jgi:regulator of sigma D
MHRQYLNLVSEFMNTSTAERRTGTQDIIEKLLAERQSVLVMFCELAGMEAKRERDGEELKLQRFCELLVDYSAFAHFEIYERIIDGRERRSLVVHAAQEVYSQIAEATDAAVDFNDRYDAYDHELDMDRLGADLSRLGEQLAIRIEMEDRIIAALVGR